MIYLNSYNKFGIITENSKNDPIPEINNKSKTCIILMGAPGIGKSFFISNFIFNKNRNFKVFSTDDVSLLYTKDPNEYKPNSNILNMKRIYSYVKNSAGSFIFDTTGTHKDNVIEIVNLSKENGYSIIFIHLIGTLDMSLKQNKQRDRNVDVDYIMYSYKSQTKNIGFYSSLNPDKYYIVYNIDGKYKFFMYDGGKLLQKKVDKYTERIIKPFRN